MKNPPIPDRAGRGALCAIIDQLTKEAVAARSGVTKHDKDELPRILHRLDQERKKLLKLYQYTPKSSEEAHERYFQ